eukprot:g5417.t1
MSGLKMKLSPARLSGGMRLKAAKKTRRVTIENQRPASPEVEAAVAAVAEDAIASMPRLHLAPKVKGSKKAPSKLKLKAQPKRNSNARMRAKHNVVQPRLTNH